MLTNIRIVLVATSHPGNIGSSARAMKTMGLSELVLVNPKMFPHAKATELAAGADDVLTNARVVTSLQEALAGCRLAVATSARPRELTLPTFDPHEVAKHVITEAADAPVAIVFGREATGLTNEELLSCHYHVIIPANEVYSSLNLAAAVQIICYELHMASLGDITLPTVEKDRYATVNELENFYQHLESVLKLKGFLNPQSPKRIMPRFRRLFTRIRLENREVRLLRGILTMIGKQK